MRRIIRYAAAACAMAGALLLVGCGTSPRHLSVSVGRQATFEMVRSATGHTSVQVTVGARDCLATRVSGSWNDVAARVRTC
jgi:hypothetical protein